MCIVNKEWYIYCMFYEKKKNMYRWLKLVLGSLIKKCLCYFYFMDNGFNVKYKKNKEVLVFLNDYYLGNLI